MSDFEYLPDEYSYACYLAYIYDLHPYDSTIHYMVSERYPREEDDDDASASASDSDIDEAEESGVDEVVTTSAQLLESSASHNQFIFGSFVSAIVPISTPSIEPKFDGFSIKIGEISCAIVDPCCNIVQEDECVFVDSQEDEKLEVLEPELKNRSSDFVVSAAPEVLIDTLPVRSCSSVYGVAAVRLFASWLFVEKQSEHPVSAFNNLLLFLKLHDESIVDFDPGGSVLSCSLFSDSSVLRCTSFCLLWIPCDRGKKRFSALISNNRSNA